MGERTVRVFPKATTVGGRSMCCWGFIGPFEFINDVLLAVFTFAITGMAVAPFANMMGAND
jgi:hypothetical protein